MTSQRVERTWIGTGGYGRFRGEWVKLNDLSRNPAQINKGKQGVLWAMLKRQIKRTLIYYIVSG